MSADPIGWLHASGLCGELSEEQLRALHPPPEWLSVPAGHVLIKQGQSGPGLFVLIHGRMRAFVNDGDGTERAVGDIAPGETVGEMSLITGEPTSASVRAMHDCDVIRISAETFASLVRAAPEAGLNIARIVINRLRRGAIERRQRIPYSGITIVPADGSNLHVELARYLTQELAQYFSILQIDSSIIPARFRHEAETQERLSQQAVHELYSILRRLQDQTDIVVYTADVKASAWTRFCLAQGSLVLLTSATDAPAAPGQIERDLIRRIDPLLRPRIDLVLLREADADTRNTSDHLRPRDYLSEHHHVRCWHAGDIARLGRMVTGRSVGLALGGGGARGLAHIGVIRALREAGIPIDCIAGSSMGSLIGAQTAMDLSHERMTADNRRIWVDGNPLTDYTFPALSLVRGRRLHNLVRHELLHWHIEDLPIPFFCVSGDLTDVSLLVHSRGALWPAVRASGSLPGAGPPLFFEGRVLVDGGVLNNLPGDLLAKRFGGTIIASDVSPHEKGARLEVDLEETPSGLQVLWERLSPFARRRRALPSVFEILYGSATLSSRVVALQTHKLVDLLFTPPLQRYSIVQFKAIDEIIEVGYRHAIEVLERVHREGNPMLLNRLYGKPPATATRSRQENADERSPQPEKNL